MDAVVIESRRLFGRMFVGLADNIRELKNRQRQRLLETVPRKITEIDSPS
jgi:hypothetical protein